MWWARVAAPRRLIMETPLITDCHLRTGFFPGQTVANQIAGSANDQLLTGGLRNGAPTVATITGILTEPNFRIVIHALEQRSGFENLAEPEVTTTSGRQTQMRATDIKTIITELSFQQGGYGSDHHGHYHGPQQPTNNFRHQPAP